jgi:hypothetical protein
MAEVWPGARLGVGDVAFEAIPVIMQDMDLGELIKQHGAELKEAAAGLAEGKREKVVAALGTLILGMATGSPMVGLLAPFVEAGAHRAFASSASRRLDAALAAAKSEQEKTTLITQIADSIESLLGQALIQMVHVQHGMTDEIIAALGGMRKELADFRTDFQKGLDEMGVRVDAQMICDGATGIRISEGARAQIWVGKMTVSGSGSVGINVGRW